MAKSQSSSKKGKRRNRQVNQYDKIFRENIEAPLPGLISRLRHLQQLRILAQLRNLAPDSLQIMDSIANYISEEKDILYRRGEKKGIEKGIEKGKETFVRNLLLNTDFTIAKIAGLTNVTESFVKKVKKTLK